MKKVNSYFIKFSDGFVYGSLCISEGFSRRQIVWKIFNIFTKTFVIPHDLCYNISVCR